MVPTEESVWRRLGALSISTIVTSEMRDGQAPPESAIMMWDIAHAYRARLRRSPSDADAASFRRIREGCRWILLLYDKLDDRANSSPIDPVAVSVEGDPVSRETFVDIARACTAPPLKVIGGESGAR